MLYLLAEVSLFILTGQAYSNMHYQMPTIFTAVFFWIVALPIVVEIDYWLMSDWNWKRLFRVALFGNLWGILEALPIGLHVF